MNRMIIVLGFVLVLSTLNAQTKNFIDQAYIETISQVDTLVLPDRIFLSIMINERDTKGRTTVEELENLMGKKLESLGIDVGAQLSLSDLSSNFKKYFLRKQDVNKSKAYELLVYDAKVAGKVIFELEGLGISNVDLDRTEYSKIEELKLVLKSKAVKKAKKQANALLDPLEQSIGKAIFISDVEANNSNILQGRLAGVRLKGYGILKEESEALSIEFEKLKVTSRVEVKFIIQ